MKVDNHKKLCDPFLSTSDICRLISIEFDRQCNDRLLTTIEIIDMLRPALWAASYAACVVYTKTIIHLSVGESGGYLPPLR